MKSFLRKAGKLVAFIMAFAMVITSVPEIGAVRVAEAADVTYVGWAGTETSLPGSGTGTFSFGTDGFFSLYVTDTSNTKMKNNTHLQIANNSTDCVLFTIPASTTGVLKFTPYQSGSGGTAYTLKTGDNTVLSGSTTNGNSAATEVTSDKLSPGDYTLTGSGSKHLVIKALSVTVTYQEYTVTFMSGDETLSSQTVNGGSTVSAPATNPTRSGYRFNGWYSDEECTEEFDFTSAITENTTIFAGWDQEYTITCNTASNGSITASPNPAIEEEEVTVTGTPADGYVLDHIIYYSDDMSTNEIVSVFGNQATFDMPAKNVTIAPFFITQEAYDAMAPKWDLSVVDFENTGATITLSTDSAIEGTTTLSQVMAGTTVYIHVKAADGYYCSEVDYSPNDSGTSTIVDEKTDKEATYSFIVPVCEYNYIQDGENEMKIIANSVLQPKITAASDKGLTLSKSYGMKDETVEVTVDVPEGKLLKGLTYKVGENEATALEATDGKYIITIPNNEDDIYVDAEYADAKFSVNMKDYVDAVSYTTYTDSTKYMLPMVIDEANGVSLLKAHAGGITQFTTNSKCADYSYGYHGGGYPQASSKNKDGRSVVLNLLQDANVRIYAYTNGQQVAIGKTLVTSSGASGYENLFADTKKLIVPFDVRLSAGTHYIYGYKGDVYISAVDVDYESADLTSSLVTVNYDTNISSDSASNVVVSNANVQAGSKLNYPGDPTLDGYVCTGWYNGDTQWDFANDTVPAEGLTLTAHYQEAKRVLTIDDSNTDATLSVTESDYVTANEDGTYTFVATKPLVATAILTEAAENAHKGIKDVYIEYDTEVEEGSEEESEHVTATASAISTGFKFNTMPMANATLKVATEQKYAVTAKEVTGGSVTITEGSYRFADEGASIEVTPDDGYICHSVKVTVGDVTTPYSSGEAAFTTKDIPAEDLGAADAVVEPVFEKVPLTITSVKTNTILTIWSSATVGDEVSFYAEANSGYKMSEISVVTASGEKVEYTATDDTHFKFIMPGEAVTVTANAGKVYTLTLNSVSNADVEYTTSAEGNEVISNATITVKVTPAEGYRVAKTSTNSGVSYTASGEAIAYAEKSTEDTYTFTMPENDVVVDVAIEKTPQYTITFDLNGHGTAIDEQKVYEDAKATKPTDPTEEGYLFGGWTLNGDAYDFDTAVTADITLKATWSIDTSTYEKILPTGEGTGSAYKNGVTYGKSTDILVTTSEDISYKVEDGTGIEYYQGSSNGDSINIQVVRDTDVAITIKGSSGKTITLKEGSTTVASKSFTDGSPYTFYLSLEKGKTYVLSGSGTKVMLISLLYKCTGELVAHEHNYKVDYNWSEDKSQCTQTKVCSTCADSEEGHSLTETVDSVYTHQDSTKETEGYDLYTATFTDGTVKENKTTLPVLHSHIFGAWSFKWADDYSSVVATRTCTTENCTEEDRTQTETVTPTSEVKDGKRVYTATLSDGSTDTKSVDLNPESHTHSYGAWGAITWSTDYKTASRVKVCSTCDEKVEGHSVTETVASTSVRTEPTTSAEGKVVYTVEFADGTKDTKEVTLPKLTPGESTDYTEVPVEDPDDPTAVGFEYDYNKTHYYTGAAITPAIAVYYNNEKLVEGKDYKVSYKNNTKVASAADGKKAPLIKVSGLGNFTGNYEELTFNIVELETESNADAIDISKYKVEGFAKSYTYTGAEIQPTGIKLVDKKAGVTIDVDSSSSIDVVYAANVNKGNASVLFVGKNEYTGAVKGKFKIDVVDMSTCTAHVDDTVAYKAAGAKPEVTVTDANGNVLESGKDYTVKYTAKYGKTGVATITGKGNYKGKITENFTVAKNDITDCDIIVVPAAAGSKASKVAVLVFDQDGTLLKAKTDYTLSTTSRKDTVNEDGDTVTITGAGAFEGTTEEAIPVVSGGAALKAKATKTSSKIYNGEAQTLTDTDLEVTANKMKVYEGQTDGYEIVGYTNNVNKGTATAYVVGTGKITGYSKVTFKIVSKALIKK